MKLFVTAGNVLDPTCGVADSGPIFHGQNVTMTCSLTYHTSHLVGGTRRLLRKVDPRIDWIFLGLWRRNKSETVMPHGEGGTLQVSGSRLRVFQISIYLFSVFMLSKCFRCAYLVRI